MASVYYLCEDALNTEEEIVTKYKDHGNEAKRLHFAAVKIQSAFRGYLVRSAMKQLNRLATLIQKTFRGWLVRYHLPDVLHEFYDRRNQNCYNEMATKIQALFRGYQVRKEVCIKSIRERRAKINAANADIQKEMEEMKKKNYVLRHKINIEKILTVLFDRHHLLRTQQIEGVLSEYGTQELSALEKFLDAMEWKPYMDKLRQIYCAFNKEKEKYDLVFPKEIASTDNNKACLRKAPKQLAPPDHGIHKKPFKLSSKLAEEPYSRMIGTLGKYIPPSKNLVRTEDKSKNISRKDFNIYTLKQVANEADVPPYYIDVWFEQCRIHNLPSFDINACQFY